MTIRIQFEKPIVSSGSHREVCSSHSCPGSRNLFATRLLSIRHSSRPIFGVVALLLNMRSRIGFMAGRQNVNNVASRMKKGTLRPEVNPPTPRSLQLSHALSLG